MRRMKAEKRLFAEKRGSEREKGLIYGLVEIFEPQAKGPLKTPAYFRPSLAHLNECPVMQAPNWMDHLR